MEFVSLDRYNMKIHKGDTVKIRSGKDRGKTGKVMIVDYKKNTILVEGLNLYKKHQRSKRKGEKGEVVNISRPLTAAKLMVVCPSCGQAGRLGHREDQGRKSRYCKKCQAIV